jgi:ABC-type multidrug transport system ATPase subunit
LAGAETGSLGEEATVRAKWWLARLGLQEFALKRFSELSAGYRMRAAICFDIVRRP